MPRTVQLLLWTALCATCGAAAALVDHRDGPPPTRTDGVIDVMHGIEIRDDYRWLEALEAESREVAEWTTKQNAFTRHVLDGIPGRAHLESRLGELLRTPAIAAPAMRGDLLIYRERPADRNQFRLMVRSTAQPDAPARVLIDPDELDESGLIALDWFAPSHDGSLVAFGLSRAGDEMSVLHIIETATGRWLADEIAGKATFGGWHPDGRSFLYGMLEDPSDAYSRVWKFHEIGRHHRQDPVLVRQEEPSRIPGAHLSADGRWIIVQMFEGWARQELFAVDAREWFETGTPRRLCLACGLDARFEPQFVRDDLLYVLTTYQAPTGRLIAIDLDNRDEADWITIIPARDDATLDDVSDTRDRMIATYTVNASTNVRMFSFDGEPIGSISLPGIGSARTSTWHGRSDLYLSFTSFNDPTSIYHVDPETDRRTLWARPEVPVDPDLFTVRQLWTTSADGTKVPYFLVHRRDVSPDGKRPAIVYGYGGFNVSITPGFRSSAIPFIEAGGIYVSVTLRGGGEFGEAWHRAGMLGRKQNVYDDLYAATEHLIESGWTAPRHIAVFGGSNGGLLTGVAAMQRPELFRAIVSAVPLLDMLRFQHFLMARFWIPEYGDPDRAEDFEWIRAYSPYHNVVAGREYPAMLITAGENDNRVHPMHARKMVARAQAKASNHPLEKPILLWVDRDSGHGQGKPLRLQIQDAADIIGFMAWQTGLDLSR